MRRPAGGELRGRSDLSRNTSRRIRAALVINRCAARRISAIVDAVVEFRITGRQGGGIDRYQLWLVDGRGSRARRDARRSALTLELEPVAFLWLVGGTASAGRLFDRGQAQAAW